MDVNLSLAPRALTDGLVSNFDLNGNFVHDCIQSSIQFYLALVNYEMSDMLLYHNMLVEKLNVGDGVVTHP